MATTAIAAYPTYKIHPGQQQCVSSRLDFSISHPTDSTKTESVQDFFARPSIIRAFADCETSG